MAKLVSKGNSNFVVGVVSYINDTNPAVTNISMVLNEYDREKKETTTCYLNAAGWENSVENGPMANMPERIKKAKLAPGSLVMLRCGKISENGVAKNGTARKSATLYDFQYSSLVENEKNSIVLGHIGNVETRLDQEKNKVLVVSIAVNVKKDETRWITARFSGKSYEAAEKFAVKGKPFAAIGSLSGDKMTAYIFVAAK